MFEIQQEILKDQKVASVRLLVMPDEVPAAIEQARTDVLSFLEDQGSAPSGPAFVRYYTFQPDRVSMEVGFPINEPVGTDGAVGPGTLPGGLVVHTWHKGPYENLQDTYHALEGWIKRHGYDFQGAPWEVYWTGPDDEEDPKNWRTQVFWPIKHIDEAEQESLSEQEKWGR
jgi:effector-binding domain-containing protein